ncbi:MAG: glycosyltransferase [Pseudomonadota bacterium]
MIFLVYSPIAADDIETSLGVADYSYYFVMQRFLPLLEEYGDVCVLKRAPTDAEIELYKKSGPCVYLSFAPPDKLADVSACPVIPVFAWEYSTLPNESFSCRKDNWVAALQPVAHAITHSGYAKDVVASGVANAVEIASIPAPVWDSFQSTRDQRQRIRPRGLDALSLDCTVIDTDDFLISNTSIRPKPSIGDHTKHALIGVWDGSPLQFDLSREQRSLTLIGFNEPEPWGIWSLSGYPWMMFDCALKGELELTITLRGYLQNIGSIVRLEIGSACADTLLTDRLTQHVFRFSLSDASNVLAFLGLEKRAVDGEDPRDIGLGIANLQVRRVYPEEVMQDETQAVQIIALSREDLVVDGFHLPETHGRWSESADCSIQLPNAVSGNMQVSIELFHMLHNDGETIDVSLGSQTESITLAPGVLSYEVQFKDVCQTDVLRMCGLKSGPGSEHDKRLLGIGLAVLSLRAMPVEAEPQTLQAKLAQFSESMRRGLSIARQRVNTFRKKPILYTAVLNPKDGRKNWEDILTAFVYAFRKDNDVTLLIKVTYHDLEELYADIFTMLSELHPFSCRIIFIHGYLREEAYENLILQSHFVVNASRGEGQCLPLMEFMSAGVPAIAPDNTAMAEYVNRENSLIVASSPELTFWPQDPRQVFRTLWYRINWESLVVAFTDSATLYRQKRRKYQRFSQNAAESLQSYCSLKVARAGLDHIVRKLVPDHDT